MMTERQKQAKTTAEALKKISKGKWGWKPEVGEFYYHDYGNKRLFLVEDEDKAEDIVERNLVKHLAIIPLLHWERIEKILGGMGYNLELEPSTLVNYGLPERKWRAVFWQILSQQDAIEDIGFISKTRQEAVMRAVIELAKRRKKG